jgi:hypothetical protein
MSRFCILVKFSNHAMIFQEHCSTFLSINFIEKFFHEQIIGAFHIDRH